MTVSDGYLVRDLRQKLEKDPNDLSRFFRLPNWLTDLRDEKRLSLFTTSVTPVTGNLIVCLSLGTTKT